jgi:hypothetical protein
LQTINEVKALSRNRNRKRFVENATDMSGTPRAAAVARPHAPLHAEWNAPYPEGLRAPLLLGVAPHSA